MPPSPRPLSPKVLAPDGTFANRLYALIDEIGRGAAGTVWRARACATGREYAIKILHDDPGEAPKAAARFLQERAILLQLRHENLVAVHDLLTTAEGNLALVLDLVTGGTLRDLLRQRTTLPPAEAADLLAGVAAGLAAAHDAGVVHRDLKPDNILLAMRPDGGTRARLTDFGIARVLDGPRLTTTGAVLGTPNYMAPEVIEGEPATPAADVYAFGIILYELLAGRPPFDDECDTAILLRHTRAAARPVTGMPPRMWALIEACLDHDPGRRPTAVTLVSTLQVLATETAGARALPPPRTGTGAPATYVVTDRAPIGAGSTSGMPATPAAAAAGRRGWSPVFAMIVAALLAVTGYGAAQLAGFDQRERHSQAPPATAQPSPPGAERAGQPASTAPAAPSAPGTSAASPAPVVSILPATPVAEREATRIAISTPEGFSEWICSPTYRWALAHPVIGKACHAIGPGVRVIGTLKAAPTVRADVSILVQDAETNAVAAGPFDCPDLQFTETEYERSCGPFGMDLERGRQYRIVQHWRYTGMGILPGGSVSGDPFTW